LPKKDCCDTDNNPPIIWLFATDNDEYINADCPILMSLFIYDDLPTLISFLNIPVSPTLNED